ncbi:protealysin inhibitor emfourin [Streptomyces sp. NPDC048277]|uniref:protealysin inhibitor emfourin n=1 Tax=Streptomyces sp. NPDC048277 TaxID=3155027 RepID=UPI0034044BF0
MKVTLVTHGGQAAGINLRLPPRTLDSGTLPSDAAAELARLVAAAVPEAGKERPHGRPAPDAMSYTITVEDGGRTTVLTQSDTTMSPAFAALLGRLEQYFAQPDGRG